MTRATGGRIGAVLALLAIALYIAFVAWLYAAQERLIYVREPVRITPAEAGLPIMRDVVAKTADGLAIAGWYAPPADGGKPVALFFHGNAGGVRYNTRTAQGFIDRGYGILMAEYRGYNGNPGRASEAGVYADARAWLGFLTDDERIAPRRIVIVGQSFGTGVAVRLARETPQAAALVLLSPYTSLPDAAAAKYPFVPVRWLMRDRFDSLALIPDIRLPVLILHGGQDKVIPARLGRALYDAARAPQGFRVFSVRRPLQPVRLRRVRADDRFYGTACESLIFSIRPWRNR